MSTTYNALTTAVKDWCARTDSKTISYIPQFIAAAQTALDPELRITPMVKTVTYNTDTVSLDATEFMDISSVLIGGLVGTSTTLADVTALRMMVNARPETTGYDFHYAMNGNNIELVRPNAVTLTGYQKPPRLSDSVQTNAYTDGAENALLWLSLYYCAAFAKDSEAQDWQDMATAEITNLNAARDKFVKTGTAKVKRRGYF
ncbi:phage adaptor protein [Lelliottia nimipressuralis]|uniref:Phage tail protein n=1 Tax=Lelliottia nimipressuralis TaxID=69220 RepID=A0ABD4KJ52_9ENTR|nr:hypothetical protein [Lelliottia nimipressuralis]MBF4180594.1 hypothetical protein [Lelliottia nimipressuralis]